MAKKLTVPIVADSAAFKAGLKESEHAAQQFESKIKGTTSNVKSHILGMGAAFIGVGGLVEGIKKSVEAAVELDQATSQMDAQFKANGESAKAYTAKIQVMNAQLERVGFTNTQTDEAFSRLSRSAGDSSVALKYMGLTADLAASKHVSLSAAALVVGKVIQGSTSAMNRYGIIIPKGTSATDALRIAQQKLAGQAKAMAKPTEVFSTILTDLEAKIGKALLPTIDKYMTKIETWIGKSDNQRKVTDTVTSAVKGLTQIIQTVVPWLEKGWHFTESFSGAMGGFKNTVIVLTAAFAGYKAGLIATSFAETVMGATGVGALTAIKGALVSTGIGAAFVGLGLAAGYVITHWSEVKGWFGTFWGWLKAGWRDALDLVKGLFYGWVAAVVGELKLLADGAAKALGWLPGIGGKLKDAASAIDGWFSDFSTKSKNAFADIGTASGNSFANSYISALTAQQAAMTAAAGGSGTSAGATVDSRGQGGRSTGATGGGTFTQAQMSALLVKAGASPQLADILANIGHNYESGGRAGAISGVNSNGTRDYGLFQINSSHGYSKQSMLDPLQNAKQALSIYHSQGFGAWTEAGGAAAKAKYGNWLGSGGGGSSSGALPGDAIAAAANAKKAAAAAKAAASAAYKSWKDNYFTPLDNQYKSDMLITDESKRLNKLEALHAKLAIDLKGTTGKEHQDILNEEDKVQAKIQSLKQKQHNAAVALIAKEKAAYIASLQAQQAALTSQLSKAQTELTKQQTVFDRAWSRIADKVTSAFNATTQAGIDAITAKYGASTPEEQAAQAFQAQLDAAQRAADFAGAQGDPVALQQVTDKYKLQDLQDAATKARAIANATAASETTTYQNARNAQLQNLNDWLADQKAALENGSISWDQFWAGAFSDAPAKYAPDAVSSLQGVINQMQAIADLQARIDANAAAIASGKGLVGAGAYNVPGAGSESSAFHGYVKMAAGGAGTVTKPTWFLAGEAGNEDYAFSGGGKSFAGGSGGGGGQTVVLQVGPVYGAMTTDIARQWAATLKTELDRVIQYR